MESSLFNFLEISPNRDKRNVILGCTGSVATIKFSQIVKNLEEKGHKIVIIPTDSAIHFLYAQALAEKKILKENKSNLFCKMCGIKSDYICSSTCHQNSEVIDDRDIAYIAENLNQNQLDSSVDGNVDGMKLKSIKDNVINCECKMCQVKKSYPNFKFICDSDEWNLWEKRGDPVVHIKLRDWADLLLLAPLDANTLAKLAQGLCDNLLTCVIRAWDLKKPLIFCPAMNTHMYSHPFTQQHITILKVSFFILSIFN